MKIHDLKVKEPYCKIAARAKLCLEVEQRRRIGGWVSRVLMLEKTTLHSYKLKGDNGSMNTWAIGDSEVYAKRPRKDGRYVVLVTRPHAFNIIFAINSLHEQASFLQALSTSGATIMGIYGIFLLTEHKNVQTAMKLSLEDEQSQNLEGKRLYNSLREIKNLTKPKTPVTIPQLSSRMIEMSWFFNDHVKERRYSAPPYVQMGSDVEFAHCSAKETVELEEAETPYNEYAEIKTLDRYRSISEEGLSTALSKSHLYGNDEKSNSTEDCSGARIRKVAELVNVFEKKRNPVKIKDHKGSEKGKFNSHHDVDHLNTVTYDCNPQDILKESFPTVLGSDLQDVEVRRFSLNKDREMESHLSSLSNDNENTEEDINNIFTSKSIRNSQTLQPECYEVKDTFNRQSKYEDEILLSGELEVSNSINEEFQRKFVTLKKEGILFFLTIENDSKLEEFSNDFCSKNAEIICLENLSLFLSSENDGQKFIVLKRDDQCIKAMKFETEADLMIWKNKLLQGTTMKNLPSIELTPVTSIEDVDGQNFSNLELNTFTPDQCDEADVIMEKPILDSPYKGLKRRMVIKRQNRSKSCYNSNLDQGKLSNFNVMTTNFTTVTTSTVATTNSINTFTTTASTSTNAATTAGSSTTTPNTSTTIIYNNNNSNNNNNENNNSSHSSVQNVITLFENQQTLIEKVENTKKPLARLINNRIPVNVAMLLNKPTQYEIKTIDVSDNRTCHDTLTSNANVIKSKEVDKNIKCIIESFDASTKKVDFHYNFKVHDIGQKDKGIDSINTRPTALTLSSQSIINSSSESDILIGVNSSTTSDSPNIEIDEESEECGHEISVTVVKEKFELLNSLIQKNITLGRTWEHNSIRQRKNVRNKLKRRRTLEGVSRVASIKRNARRRAFSRESSREENEIPTYNKQNNLTIVDIISNEGQALEDNCNSRNE